MVLQVGQDAPLFSLYDTEKKKVNLQDCRGKKVLILFFPLAFTSTCTKELCSIRDNIAFYNNTQAEVLGISVDSLYSLGRFKAEQNLNFSLLSDFNKEVSQAYGAYYDQFGLDMKGVSKRAAFILDKAGKIAYAEVLEDAGQVPDFLKIEKVISILN